MAEVVIKAREVTWQVCQIVVSTGAHDGWQPDRSEEAARRRLARAREDSRRFPEVMPHVHRIERVTTSELLDW